MSSSGRSDNVINKWINTFLLLGIHDGLQLAALAIAGSLKDVETGIRNQVAFLIHVPDWPVAELAVVDNLMVAFRGAIAEGEGSAGELGRLYALHFALAHRSHR